MGRSRGECLVTSKKETRKSTPSYDADSFRAIVKHPIPASAALAPNYPMLHT